MATPLSFTLVHTTELRKGSEKSISYRSLVCLLAGLVILFAALRRLHCTVLKLQSRAARGTYPVDFTTKRLDELQEQWND